MKIVGKSAEFTQEQDCCGPVNDPNQYLHVETMDGGNGSYLVIKTQRWALDPEELEQFVATLKSLLVEVES